MTAKKIVKIDEKSVDKRFGKLYHIKAVDEAAWFFSEKPLRLLSDDED